MPIVTFQNQNNIVRSHNGQNAGVLLDLDLVLRCFDDIRTGEDENTTQWNKQTVAEACQTLN